MFGIRSHRTHRRYTTTAPHSSSHHVDPNRHSGNLEAVLYDRNPNASSSGMSSYRTHPHHTYAGTNNYHQQIHSTTTTPNQHDGQSGSSYPRELRATFLDHNSNIPSADVHSHHTPRHYATSPRHHHRGSFRHLNPAHHAGELKAATYHPNTSSTGHRSTRHEVHVMPRGRKAHVSLCTRIKRILGMRSHHFVYSY